MNSHGYARNEMTEPRTSSAKPWSSHVHSCMLNNMLVILTVLGVLAGVAVGLLVRQGDPSQDVIIWIGLLGDVYLRMLKMLILPLIICSIISGTASMDPKCNGRISLISLIYIITSNSLACIVPLIIAVTVKPGEGVNLTPHSETQKNPEVVIDTLDIFADLIRNLFPDNIVAACFRQAQTKYHTEVIKVIKNETTGLGQNLTWNVINSTTVKRIKDVGVAESTNVLGLVLCSLIFGMSTSALGPGGKPFLAFFQSANEVIMKVLRWFVWFTPIGVASLIAVALLEASDLDSAGRSLGIFSLSVLGSLAIHQLILVPLVYLILVRENPYKFLITLGRPWVVSFATASSAVAIPENLTALEEKNNIDKRITRFVVPFATTINRDGSCMFIVISCVFIAQLSGLTLPAGKIVLIWILTTTVSVAIPSVPSAGIVAIIINLTALGIPSDLVGLLFATEWLLDRFRSASNLLSHAHCAMITYRFCKSYLPPVRAREDIDITEGMLKD